ncbi:hypothetical protein Efla_005278 [Eimeria flavescens]
MERRDLHCSEHLSLSSESMEKETGLYAQPLLNEKLYLHGRGFEKIEHLDEYTEVRAIWLQGNGIRRIENLQPLVKLRCLFLQQNCLTRIENLASCPDLMILDLSENNIRRIEGLEGLRKLCSFKIARNKLRALSVSRLCCTNVKTEKNTHVQRELTTKDYGVTRVPQDIRALTTCPGLNDVDLSHNNLCILSEAAEDAKGDVIAEQEATVQYGTPAERGFMHCFQSLPHLSSLYLMGNPLTKQIKQYRRAMIANLHVLRFLDERPVKAIDRDAAKAWYAGGEEEERKVWKAHRDSEIERLTGHVSSLRALQVCICSSPGKRN